MWVSLLSYFEFVAGWLCFVFFTNDIFLYVLIAELSDSLHATLLWITNTLTHTLFPPVTMLFKTNSLSFSCTHTQHHALLCSIMSPPLTVPEKISLFLGRPPLRSLSVHSYFFLHAASHHSARSPPSVFLSLYLSRSSLAPVRQCLVTILSLISVSKPFFPSTEHTHTNTPHTLSLSCRCAF